MKLVLGIDTSCYTTSVALMGEDGCLVADERRLLSVRAGGRGLAQSEMVYQHTRRLPELFAAAAAKAGGPLKLTAVAASTLPRSLPESYMPAFLVGAGYARVVAAAQAVPFISLSHQEGHILAGAWSAGGPSEERYLAVHASGGTTEIVLVVREAAGLKVEALGGTCDIAAGQLIDRVGVALGLPFPAGPRLEELALEGQAAPASLPVAARGLRLSFAGPETHAQRLLARGEAPAAVAAGIQACVAESLLGLCRAAVDATGAGAVLFVGGVLANAFIRGRITTVLGAAGLSLYFPEPRYSGDNAVGAACRARFR
ncbi:O-sialoglycoprotein endopeptidase [Anaeroselena agilis]|uniref:N(6)-L-threonylcarbamoyladenine synthase n=1 Tax=Anaeroselena agilis TaxID=3063788 RepID=A0ABU3NW86_9FIRM|nr:O-sialoglycoprotein endopeptidase [Selenomonadales bacterium 4137-cl]